MRRVLIPTDFSENSINAVTYVFELFRHDPDTEYVILNAYDVPRSGSTTMLVNITDILQKDSTEGLENMEKIINGLNHTGTVRYISRHGQLLQVIQDLLNKEEYNGLVMGTLGAGGLKKVLIGSNTSEVVRKIKKPILIVPNETIYTKPDKICFTTDYKKIKRDKQIANLRDFSENIGSEIMILNVQKPGSDLDIEKAKKESGIEELFEGTRHSYHTVESDNFVEGIDAFVRENDIKVLAMILRQIGFIDSLFHKSLTKEMAMHTKIPMLALHD